MFRCSFGSDTDSKEFHVDDIARNFPEQVKEFLQSKKNFRRGKQIQSVREHTIQCLTEILDEIEEDGAMIQ